MEKKKTELINVNIQTNILEVSLSPYHLLDLLFKLHGLDFVIFCGKNVIKKNLKI